MNVLPSRSWKNRHAKNSQQADDIVVLPDWAARLHPHGIDELLQGREKAGVIRFIDMFVVPETGSLDAFTVAFVAKPGRRGGIHGLAHPIAEKGNRIALDETAEAFLARLVVYLQPNERQTANVIADGQFNGAFCGPNRFPIN